MKIWNARAVRAKCADLSTFEKINIQLSIFHWETNSILGSRLEKKAQVLDDLSKNTSMALEVNFLFATRISIGFYHNLLSFISDHRWWIMTFSEWIWINLCKKKTLGHILKIVVNYEIKQNIYTPDVLEKLRKIRNFLCLKFIFFRC